MSNTKRDAQYRADMALLYDFYGELLTEKQRDFFALHYSDDLSLSEIAENEGMTRQGARDFISRGEQALLEIERKLGLVSRHRDNLRLIEEIEEQLRAMSDGGEPYASEDMGDIFAKLAKLKE